MKRRKRAKHLYMICAKKMKSYGKNRLGLKSFKGIPMDSLIRRFADSCNYTIIGDPMEWLVDLYLSQTDIFLSPEDKNFYASAEWKLLRMKVLTKYGKKCMKCGEHADSPHVDHIKPRSLYPDLELVFDNLQVMCPKCNMAKGNKDTIDYRAESFGKIEKKNRDIMRKLFFLPGDKF